MKRTIYLAAISIITVMCVVFGSFARYSHDGAKTRHLNKLSGAQQLDEFDTITAIVDVADLKIEAGEEYGISYNCTEGLMPKWSVENGELKITQNKKNFNFFGINNSCSIITVTVPDKNKLEKINIGADVGDIELDGIKSDYLSIDLDVGDMKIKNCQIDKSELESDTGDINIDDCAFKNLDIGADVGDVSISAKTQLTDYSFDLGTDVGEVSINSEDFGRKYKANGNLGEITVKSDVGNIEVIY